MHFAEPAWLGLVLLAPVPALLGYLRASLGWPTLAGFQTGRRRARAWGRHLPSVIRGLAIVALAVALARPRLVVGIERIAARGVAIIVVLDQSSSMRTRDFAGANGQLVSRLEAARDTFSRFVAGRPDDLIGLVVFANYPDLASPPTLDHRFLLDMARSVKSARPGDDGTNIGDAVAWGLAALAGSTPPRKALILMTDGDNEPAVPNPLDPREAAQLAARLGITLHTVAIGRSGGIVRDRRDAVTGLEIPAEVGGPNLALLSEMAELGGGRMFQASDVSGLDGVFRELDSLEKSPITGTVRTRYRDLFFIPIAISLGLLVCDRLLSAGRLRSLP